MSAATGHTHAEQAAIWHEAECGGYGADLSLWRSLAAEASGPILELGCGSGRVALDLARRGSPVCGLDHDADLVAALAESSGDLLVEAVEGDLTDFDLGRRFGLILAPMQVMQLLESSSARGASFERITEHLEPGGVFAAAIVEGAPHAAQAPDRGPVGTLPDIAERDGWVYSSLPLGVAIENETMIVRRLRQVVSPAGELTESQSFDRLAIVDADQLEAEAVACGLKPTRRLEVAATDAHIGSLVLLMEAAE